MTTEPEAKRFRAAQYVRMSTDQQQYSTQNQADKIAEYAQQRNIDIVRTYADEGKSGLSIGGRASLQKLITDVETGVADFSIVLVYDVSRWGRFQDADEAAFHEYVLKRKGIQVTYVAEQFENDGSPVSTIVKGVKRAMAGEYSRELSTKVFIGQCRLIELGFRQGGHAGYGYRRIMIDQMGEFKGELKRGERKCISTYRVVLVPGPAEEVELVNNMYRWLVDDKLTVPEIVRRLNGMQVSPEPGLPWTFGRVRQILTNEKYIGNNLYNRRSYKLKTSRISNPPEMWIRKEAAFPGIVPKEMFVAASALVKIYRSSSEELLDQLKQLFEKTGVLSRDVINQTPGMPTVQNYISRFGSLRRAYELIGYWPTSDPDHQEANRRIRRMHPEIIERTHAAIAKWGGSVWRDPKTDLMHVNQELIICVLMARCHTDISGEQCWRVRFDPVKLAPDITIAIRLNDTNQSELDYYVMPALDLAGPALSIFSRRESSLDCFRFDSLDFFYGMAERMQVVRRGHGLPRFARDDQAGRLPRFAHEGQVAYQ